MTDRVRRFLRWTAWSLGALVLLALLSAGAIYLDSERILRRIYSVRSVAVTLPTDSSALARGEQLAGSEDASAGWPGAGCVISPMGRSPTCTVI